MFTAFLENLPTGVYYILSGFGIILFILLYLRWTSDFFSHRIFKLFFALFSTIALLALLFLFIFQNKPTEKLRIAIFPFYNTTPDSNTNWMAWAMPDIIAKNLNFETAKDYFWYPPCDIREMVLTDSLSYQEYQKRVAKQLKLDVFMIGQTGKNEHSFFCEYQVKAVDSGTLFSERFMFDNIDTLYVRGLKIAKKFQNRIFDQNSIQTSNLPKFRTSSLILYYRAQNAVFENKIASANSLINQAIKEDSTNTYFWLLLAETKLKEGAFAKKNGETYQSAYDLAWRCLKTAHRLDSSLTQINQLKAQYYILTEKWAGAEQELITLYRINPNLPLIYLYFSQLHPSRFHLIGFENEIKLLERALFLNPGYLPAAMSLADYYIDFLQDRRKAIATLNKMLEINPNQTQVLMRLGQLYISENNNFQVMEIFRKILELEPDNSNAYYNLGIYYHNHEDMKNALNLFERAIQIDNHLDAHLYAAYIFEHNCSTEPDSVRRDSLLNQAIEHLRYRLKNKRGKDDPYAKAAREHLYQIFHH
jgi:tetratricopeptide (TPR) repeat protein